MGKPKRKPEPSPPASYSGSPANHTASGPYLSQRARRMVALAGDLDLLRSRIPTRVAAIFLTCGNRALTWFVRTHLDFRFCHCGLLVRKSSGRNCARETVTKSNRSRAQLVSCGLGYAPSALRAESAVYVQQGAVRTSSQHFGKRLQL